MKNLSDFINYVWSFYGTRKIYSIPGLTIENVVDAVHELARRDKNFDGTIDSIDREHVKWILLDTLKIPEDVELGSDFDENEMDEEDEMPGPVSDSYDPEFSTGERATRVRESIMKVRDRLNIILGEKLLDIVDVVDGNFPSARSKKYIHLSFTEQELRVIRFALNRAKDSV